MNSNLYEIIAHANVPRSIQELAALSGMEMPALEAALAGLEAEAKIARTKKGKYATIEKLNLIAGRVYMQHNGTPCIRCRENAESLRIDEGNKLRLLPNDLILARRLDARSCALEGVCSRGMQTLPAYVRIEQNRKSRRFQDEFSAVHASAIPCDPRIRHKIRLEGDLSIVRNNEIALLEIDEYPSAQRDMRAHVVRILGRSGSMLARMRATAETYAFPTEFPEAVEFEAHQLPKLPFPKPGETRADLRELMLFTIDGATAKDFDDAVSLERLDGVWRLGVHIADVSHYVRPGSKIDREARERVTSLYLPGYTVPMLPEVLSNDLCSLMPDVDRLAMSLTIDLDASGRVLDHQLSRSIIHSKARLTYAEVNRLWEGEATEIAPPIAEKLNEMRELYRILNARRVSRGTLDFDLPEADFVLNEKYEPVDILCPPRGEAERMIEEFMLKANEVVARLAKDTLMPLMYRVHENPDPDRIRDLEQFLNIAAKPVHLGTQPHPGKLQSVLADNAENPAIDLIRKYTLRALKKAKYSESPLGHYALALEDYCHFTSPIRRYPDLIVHRMLKLLLDGDLEQREYWTTHMGELANACSQREQASIRAERDASDIMKAAYMSHQIGRKYYGVISGVTAWGLYVTLPNTVEGLVHIAEMDDYYDYDAKRQMLIGMTTGYILKLGGQVRIRVDRVDVERGEINFELIGFADA